VRLGETLTVSPFYGWALEAAIGPWTDPRCIKVRVELSFVSSSTPFPMSPVNTKFTVEELCARRQVEHEAEDWRQAEKDWLFEEEIWQLAEEEEKRKQKEEEDRIWEKDERKRMLEVAEKEYTQQKELEKARQEKRKAVELEESGEEMEKEPEGSNKKVSF
jgi:hypothetical protein